MTHNLPLKARHAAFRRLLLAAIFSAALWPASTVFAQDYGQDDHDEEVEEIVVQATRSSRRVQDDPVRVEVVGREEIEEKLLMTPGNIAMLVAETGGVRVQLTSPALGASNIRMQGMKGRYTSLLADGLPLYGGQASGIGLLQIPPTDLGQVEIIKGAASALYGPSALGGVINLVSRRPGDEPQAEVLANITSRGGQDLTAYTAASIDDAWGWSLTGGFHRQTQQDINDDGWADLPSFERWTIRPRLFWNGDSGAKAFVTVGAMTERRTGGTLPGRTAPDGRPFVQGQEATRFDAGLVAEMPVENVGTFHLRASGMVQDHDHRFGDVPENDRHTTLFAEASLAGGSVPTNWLAGVAIQRDSYRSNTYPIFDYGYTVPAIFAQVEHEAQDDLILAASARLDAHNVYGTRLSPRISALYKPDVWTFRASIGRGFYAPTPFVEEIEDAGLSRLEPLERLRAEVADTFSFDVGHTFGPFEANVSLFRSRLHHAVRLEETATGVKLVNVDGTTSTQGAELLLRYRHNGFTVTGSYVHVDATESDEATGRQPVPLTPRHSAGLVGMWEEHGKGRIGVEAYYTGRQSLDDNPYRTRSRPYLELGVLGEIVLGKVSLFLNAENLLNIRQTRYDPLLRPARGVDGRWTVDAWSPLDGFTLNGGIRFRFGGH